MTVALLGLIVALGSSGWAANGGALILGVFNSATQRSAAVSGKQASDYLLDLQVNGGTAIQEVYNGSISARSGEITLMW